MNRFKAIVGGSALLAGQMFASSAMAGLSGNVGATSAYMFRGVEQAGGAAIQGGIDYGSESGLYAGTWVSNINFGGGTEQDIYVGYAMELGDISLDASALYYWYPEEDESGSELSTLEFVLGASFGPVSLSYSYADETNFFLGDGAAQSAGYLSLAFSMPVSEKLSFDASIGHYSGDEIERFLTSIGSTDDAYIDFSLGLSTELQNGVSASFQYIGTDIDSSGSSDDPKLVVSIGKTFDL